MNKQYQSFEEIDKDLKILRLQREIEVENLKLSYVETRQRLYPTNIFGGASGILKKLLISLVARKLADRMSR